MYSLAYLYGIKILVKDLQSDKPGLLGKANARKKTIHLDSSIVHRRRLHRSVIAEEIGHILYPPRSGHTAYHSITYYDLENRGNIEAIVAQDERMALDWATGVLVTNVEFWGAIKDNVNLLWELAEYFDVEEWFMRHKIAYIRRKARKCGHKLKWRDIIMRQ